MKKSLLLFATSLILLSACNGDANQNVNPKDSTSRSSPSDAAGFNKENFSKSTFLDKELLDTIARKCVDSMTMLFQRGSVDGLRKAYTTSVSFGSTNLQHWLEGKDIFANADSIALELGVYTAGALDFLGVDDPELRAKYQGRMTVFVWPYKKGTNNQLESLTHPFNVGSLHP